MVESKDSIEPFMRIAYVIQQNNLGLEKPRLFPYVVTSEIVEPKVFLIAGVDKGQFHNLVQAHENIYNQYRPFENKSSQQCHG